MLTKSQRDLLEYIILFQTENGGVSPSFEDMKSYMGLASKSGIHRIIVALEERHFIHRLPHHARALTVLRTPTGDWSPRIKAYEPIPALQP